MKRILYDITEYFKRISENKNLFYFSMLFGVLVHGFYLFNKLSFYDDVGFFFSIGVTVDLGRWGLELLNIFNKKIIGLPFFSLQSVNGIISLFFVSLSILILLDLFEVKSKILKYIFICVTIAFPAITALMGAMFTIPYYMFSMLIGIIGICLIISNNMNYNILGILCLVFSYSIYQAFIPFIISILLLYNLKLLIDDVSIKSIIKKDIVFVTSLILSIIIYLLIFKLTVYLQGHDIGDNNNVSTLGYNGIHEYFIRIRDCYIAFFNQNYYGINQNIFPDSSIKFYNLILVCLIIFFIIWLKSIKGIYKKIFFLCLFILLPLTSNFILVMFGNNNYGVRVHFGILVIPYFLILLIDNLKFSHYKFVKYFGTCSLIIIISFFVWFDNICYLKAYINQSRAKAYYQTLVTRIKSVDGYNENFPVVYINEFGKIEDSLKNYPEFSIIKFYPFHDLDLNIDSWKEYMNLWIGYSPDVINENDYEKPDEIVHMPHYPNDGSIKIIDSVIVVNF